jgi:putative heme-binding domain-containing protein
MRPVALLALALLAPPAAAQPKPLPADLVAPTDALSPADERKAFTLPPGFDAQLVASEPDIQKPMQMAWDAKGRLWVTTSYHYPFAAPAGKGTDKVFVLSDFDPETGKAKTVKTFASDLNIPIGVLPLPDGKSVLVSSVGEIRKYADADGDLRADSFEVLFSGFGWRDTHGMYNSYTIMPDGWVYSCHGFNNDSTVKGRDGHEVKMHSGNVFRFRPDGSRIEVYSRGQVNPFGMAVDPWFNLYTADCHSRPITQVIPGAYYESFGKPHDGLGYGPTMFGYAPGGTGMCGVAWYDADHFPKDHVGSLFLGNVVTNRVHRARVDWKGATPNAVQQPDLIASSDRWFRPVDVKLGPDGALYVADFYNKIIGHYEVDLKHPARDKDRGRLWRVVYKGDKAAAPKPHRTDFTAAKDGELFEDLFSPNLAVRFLAGHQLRHRVIDGKALDIPNPVERMKKSPGAAPAVFAWLVSIAQAGGKTVPVSEYLKLFGAKGEVSTRIEEHQGHFVRAITGRASLNDEERQFVAGVLSPEVPLSPHARRAAAEAAVLHPHADFVQPLLAALKKCAPEDSHLRHALRVALRNCLRDAAAWPKEYDATYAEIALAIPNEKAAGFLASQIKSVAGDKLPAAAEHVARYGTESDEQTLLGVIGVATSNGASPDPVLAAFKGLQARGKKLKKETADSLLKQAERAAVTFGAPAKGPNPGEEKPVLWGLRVLNALPAVVDRAASPGSLQLASTTPAALALLAGETSAPAEVRLGATEVLLRYAPEEGLRVARKLVASPATVADFRDRLFLLLANSSNKDGRLDARDALKDAPYRTAVAVGVALAGSPAGAEDLLTAVKTGKAPARLLQEKAIVERLRAANVPDLDKQLAALTKGLPPADQRITELVKKRAAVFASSKPDKEAGAKLFAKHCAACHKIGETGGKIAPQLDGIGLRGAERVLEDVLDPNRNVDQAFRARVVTTKDEKTLTGLMLRVEGEVLVLADGEGKEVRLSTKDIETNRETMLSPMPANFAEVLPEGEMTHLLAYLLDQKIPAAKKE